MIKNKHYAVALTEERIKCSFNVCMKTDHNAGLINKNRRLNARLTFAVIGIKIFEGNLY